MYRGASDLQQQIKEEDTVLQAKRKCSLLVYLHYVWSCT